MEWHGSMLLSVYNSESYVSCYHRISVVENGNYDNPLETSVFLGERYIFLQSYFYIYYLTLHPMLHDATEIFLG